MEGISEEEKLKEEGKGPKEKIETPTSIGPRSLRKFDTGTPAQTDLPFITLPRIIDVISDMLKDVPMADCVDPISKRVHRAVYDTFEMVVKQFDRTLLTDNMKAKLGVASGKVANWLRNVLEEPELRFLDKYPPEVESKEVRDWSKWLINVADRADGWGTWLHKVINDAKRMGSSDVTQKDWHDWTKEVDTGALLWRLFHLETAHLANLNCNMLTDRDMVKTGEKKTNFEPLSNEELVRTTDLT